MAYSIAVKRDLFSKKQPLCTSIIPQYLCKVLVESAFKRSPNLYFRLMNIFMAMYPPRPWETLGSFSSDDGDGNENISSKYYFPILYLFCDYLNLFNMENAQELLGSKCLWTALK